MKRRSGIFLCAVLILSVFSTSKAASRDVLVPLKHVVNVNAAQTAGNIVGTASTKDEFNRLLQESLKDLDTDFIINYTGSDVKELFRELDGDKTGKYFYGTKGYQWNVKNAHFSARGSIGNMPVRLKMEYHHTAAEEVLLNAKIEEILRSLIRPEMTALQKIDAVHDYIVLTSTYTNRTKRSPQSAYTLLEERKGVCQAYATLGYRMFERLGIEVSMVNGMTDELHSWLKVKLDGEWYNLDITYDDPVPDQKNKVQYRYALVSDSRLANTHHPTSGIAFPAAKSVKYDGRNDGHTKTYADSEVAKMMSMGKKEAKKKTP